MKLFFRVHMDLNKISLIYILRLNGKHYKYKLIKIEKFGNSNYELLRYNFYNNTYLYRIRKKCGKIRVLETNGMER